MRKVFRNIGAIPASKATADLDFFQKVKYNLEILMGQRQDDGAIMRSDITFQSVPDPKLVRLKTGQQGVTIGVDVVPTLEEYKELQTEVDTLRTDVETLRRSVNNLLTQLRSGE